MSLSNPHWPCWHSLPPQPPKTATSSHCQLCRQGPASQVNAGGLGQGQPWGVVAGRWAKHILYTPSCSIKTHFSIITYFPGLGPKYLICLKNTIKLIHFTSDWFPSICSASTTIALSGQDLMSCTPRIIYLICIYIIYLHAHVRTHTFIIVIHPFVSGMWVILFLRNRAPSLCQDWGDLYSWLSLGSHVIRPSRFMSLCLYLLSSRQKQKQQQHGLLSLEPRDAKWEAGGRVTVSRTMAVLTFVTPWWCQYPTQ